MTTSCSDAVRSRFTDMPDARVLLALSGGKDSVALLLCLHDAVKEGLIADVAACHVDHGIRGDAGRDDARFCEELCRRRGIRYAERSVDAPGLAKSLGSGIEDAARKLRYAALADACDELGCTVIATAHTADDDIETFFIRLLTGGGIAGLSGIPERRGRIVRPLIGCTGRDVQDTISAYGVTPRFDATNDDLMRTRNWVRHRLLPRLSAADGGLLDSVRDAQKLCGELVHELDRLSGDIVLRDGKCGFSCDAAAFHRLSPPVRKHLLAKELARLFRVESRHVRAAVAACSSSESCRIDLPHGWRLEHSMGVIRVFQAAMVEPFVVEKRRMDKDVWLPDGRRVLFDDERAKEPLTVRSRRPGDRLSGRRVKDAFIDRRLPLYERDRAVVVEGVDGIVWVEKISPNDKILVNPAGSAGKESGIHGTCIERVPFVG